MSVFLDALREDRIAPFDLSTAWLARRSAARDTVLWMTRGLTRGFEGLATVLLGFQLWGRAVAETEIDREGAFVVARTVAPVPPAPRVMVLRMVLPAFP
ncbi:MAG: hypothetical protein AAGA48_25000 [Myxococcota bacterium]